MSFDPSILMSRRRDEVRQWFYETGTTVTDWAGARGFHRETIYALLAGRTRGHRGEAHLAAIALGLKRAPQETPVSAAHSLVKQNASDQHPIKSGINE